MARTYHLSEIIYMKDHLHRKWNSFIYITTQKLHNTPNEILEKIQ